MADGVTTGGHDPDDKRTHIERLNPGDNPEIPGISPGMAERGPPQPARRVPRPEKDPPASP